MYCTVPTTVPPVDRGDAGEAAGLVVVKAAASTDADPLPFTPSSGACGQRLGQTEIQKLGARLGQHHVARLQVAMHHFGAMRFFQRVGDLGGNLQYLFRRQRTFFQAIRQRLALQILHH